MSNNINRRFRSFDVADRKLCYADNHNGYRRSAKHEKRASDRFARREGKKFIADELFELALI